MTSLDKMWISFIAIGLMAGSSLLISFARVKTKGFFRSILSILAFILLVIGFVYMVVTIFS